ncbi:MAG: hypothetical protein LUG16_01100 [Candidatus Gastranaerophilales bacterium]|nr:hypothetical protein [Candidatus Gastranaerophilales bacterium]
MCVEDTAQIADIASTVVNIALTVNEVYEATTTKKEGQYQTNLILQQAKQAEAEAASERQEGIEDARRTRLKAILNMADTKQSIAAGNIALSSATSQYALEDEKKEGELDALKIIKSANKSSDSYLEKAQNYYYQASLNSYKVNNAFRNSLVNAFSNAAKLGISKIGS